MKLYNVRVQTDIFLVIVIVRKLFTVLIFSLQASVPENCLRLWTMMGMDL